MVILFVTISNRFIISMAVNAASYPLLLVQLGMERSSACALVLVVRTQKIPGFLWRALANVSPCVTASQT